MQNRKSIEEKSEVIITEKSKRTKISKEQRSKLENIFLECKDKKLFIERAKETGLEEKAVINWYSRKKNKYNKENGLTKKRQIIPKEAKSILENIFNECKNRQLFIKRALDETKTITKLEKIQISYWHKNRIVQHNKENNGARARIVISEQQKLILEKIFLECDDRREFVNRARNETELTEKQANTWRSNRINEYKNDTTEDNATKKFNANDIGFEEMDSPSNVDIINEPNNVNGFNANQKIFNDDDCDFSNFYEEVKHDTEEVTKFIVNNNNNQRATVLEEMVADENDSPSNVDIINELNNVNDFNVTQNIFNDDDCEFSNFYGEVKQNTEEMTNPIVNNNNNQSYDDFRFFIPVDDDSSSRNKKNKLDDANSSTNDDINHGAYKKPKN